MSELLQTQNRNRHRPHHIYSGHTYFVTGRCYEGKKYFFDEERKRMWKKVFRESIDRFEIKTYAWVLLENHYHILFSLPQSVDTQVDPAETDFALAQSVTPSHSNKRSDEMSATNFVSQHETQTLTEFIRKLHKDSARKLNQRNHSPGRRIWYQYWDRCSRNIPDFWKHFNYILKNPLKHGLACSLEESLLYPHSSNPIWLRRFGAEGIHEGFYTYPVNEITTKHMYALVDCNNFFASCERVINPRLIGKPVVILSNNDGCIVARSNEAKKIGIPMGAPYFKWKEHLRRHGVRVFSSNYSLYGDMSRRVMETLEACMPHVSIYSIDEAFCDVSGVRDIPALAQYTKQHVEQWTGIPVSIGIGPTKTLAKVANEIAKKQAVYNGILTFHTAQDALPFFQHMPIGDVWGIGRAFGFQLPAHGIHTVADFMQQPETWIKKMMGTSGVSILHELLGYKSEHPHHTNDTRKSVIRSRSFGSRVTKKEDIMDAVTYFADKAGHRLRSEGLRTRVVQPFFSTSRFSPQQYYASKTIQLPEATHDSRVLISVAQSVVHTLFKEGLQYAKAGIVCTDIVSTEHYQKSLFSTEEPKDARLLEAYDTIKQKFGADMINIGRTRDKKNWHMKRALLSTHERKNISTVPTVLCK